MDDWTGWRPTTHDGLESCRRAWASQLGRIAQATARKAPLLFWMRIAYHSRRRAAADMEARDHARNSLPNSVDELIATSVTLISLHCPGRRQQRSHLINAERLATHEVHWAVLINTARGPRGG